MAVGDAHRPLVSVVIAAYNAEAYLEDTLRAALAQTYSPLEVVVVDDGSKDGTAALVRERFPDVHLIQQENAGQAAARNRGVEEARGEVIAFLDADDLWLPEKIARQMDVLSAHPDAALVYAGWARPGFRGKRLGGQVVPLHFLQISFGYFICPTGVVVSRERFLEVGGFRKAMTGIEDRDLWSRLALRGPAFLIEDVLWFYRSTPKLHFDFRLRHMRLTKTLMEDLEAEIDRRYGHTSWEISLAGQCFRYRFYFQREGSREGMALCDELLASVSVLSRRRAYRRLFLPYFAARIVKKAQHTEGFWHEPIPPVAAFAPTGPRE